MSTSCGVKYDWYQTETTVVVEVRIKNCPKDEAKPSFSETSCSLRAPVPGQEEPFSLALRLAHPVVPAQCQCRVLSTKIELRLQKREGLRWAGLEGDGSDPLKPGVSDPAAQAAGEPVAKPSYPSSSGKDWNRIGADIERDFEEEKPEGEAALNEMFRKIYNDASDDTKKAMAKSFSESGGTVLSTNWDDIKGKKTEVKPPDGMEFKKWDS